MKSIFALILLSLLFSDAAFGARRHHRMTCVSHWEEDIPGWVRPKKREQDPAIYQMSDDSLEVRIWQNDGGARTEDVIPRVFYYKNGDRTPISINDVKLEDYGVGGVWAGPGVSMVFTKEFYRKNQKKTRRYFITEYTLSLPKAQALYKLAMPIKGLTQCSVGLK